MKNVPKKEGIFLNPKQTFILYLVMKKFYSILSVALAISMLTVSTSCSDDDDDVNKTALLTAKQWTPVKAEREFQDEYTDITDESFPYECEDDDYLTFSTDGVYKYEIGTNDCDGDQDVMSGTWAWKEGEKILSWTTKYSSDNIETEDWIFVSMTASELKIKEETGNSVTISGVEYKEYYVVTYSGK
jgi:hypothetical protein